MKMQLEARTAVSGPDGIPRGIKIDMYWSIEPKIKQAITFAEISAYAHQRLIRLAHDAGAGTVTLSCSSLDGEVNDRAVSGYGESSPCTNSLLFLLLKLRSRAR